MSIIINFWTFITKGEIKMSCILPSLYDTSSSLLDNPDFSLLCSLFDDIRRTQDDKGAINGTIKSIKRALNRLLNAEFEVTILDNSLSSDTFVCNVYPTVLEAKKIVLINLRTNIERGFLNKI